MAKLLSPTSVAKTLLEAGAMNIRADEPFTYRSGTISPIYLNNMVAMSNPATRKTLVKAWENLITEKYKTFDAIATTVGVSIPWATLLAMRFNVPLVYVQGERKDYGYFNEIEGVLQPGQRVLVVENIIASGPWVINSVTKLRELGSQVVGISTLFDYELEETAEKFKSINVKVSTLTELNSLLTIARRLGMVSQQAERIIWDWHQDPAGWLERYQIEKQKNWGL